MILTSDGFGFGRLSGVGVAGRLTSASFFHCALCLVHGREEEVIFLI